MDTQLFESKDAEFQKEKLQRLLNPLQPPQYFVMSPPKAFELEKQLNASKDGWCLGYLLIPVRQQHQELTKPSKSKCDKQSFVVEEENILLDFYKQLQFVKKRISKKEFHCLMTLEQLRRNPISRFFMALPDPLYLKLYDYNKVIKERYDMRMIANKLLRGKYTDHQLFEEDMVKMIQNFRIYFIYDTQMFDVSVKFEMLFWNYYSNEEIHQYALEKYKIWKKKCTPVRYRKKEQSFTTKGKQQIAKRFNELPHEQKVIIQNKLATKIESETGRKLQNKVNLVDMQSKHLQYVIQQIQSSKKRIREGGPSLDDILLEQFREQRKKKNQDQLYFSSEDEQNKEGRQEKLKKLGQILDNISIPDVNSDQD